MLKDATNVSPVARAVADRAESLKPGLRREVFSMAAGMKDVIALGRGDPDFPTPPHIIAAAKRALDDGYTHYTPWTGLLELREAIADKLAKENGIQVDPASEVVVTSGAQEAVFLVLQLLLDPGDEILMPDPHYTAYDSGIALAGGKLVPIPTFERDNFDVRLDEIEKRITQRTKALVLVTPQNPTGSVATLRTVEGIAALAKKHDFLVISDELYEKYIYDGSIHYSIASFPGMRERTITINGFSKTYRMTGWRVGYVAAPNDFVAVLAELKYTLSICAPAVSQMAALAALKGPQDSVQEVVAILDERRRFMMSAFDEMGLTYGQPQSGFVIFVNITSTGLSSIDFCRRILQEAHVQIFPGNLYGEYGEGYVRTSILAPREQLQEAANRMKKVVESLRKK